MKAPLDALFKTIDTQIREGHIDLARHELDKLKDVKLGRPDCARFAFLAWRADVPHFGIRLLNPIVRSDRKAPIEATEEEKAEYAQCLIRIGAIEEADVLLAGIARSRLPQVWLYQASARISRWEYAEAIPLLTKYVRSGDISAYQKLVGQVNLAASMVFQRQKMKATFLLQQLLQQTSLRRHGLLYSNLLEIAAQHFVLLRKWDDVHHCLELARKVLVDEGSKSAFFVRKWEAISTLLRDEGSPVSRQALEPLRQEARERGNWESLRQFNQFEAMVTRDQALLLQVYFGTPFRSFREFFVDECAGKLKVPSEYVWYPSGGKAVGPVLDLLSGDATNGAKIKVGQLLHRLLVALSSDYYRPMRLAAVHFHLYPGEYFNPVTSPFRVYEAVKRLRGWLDENDLPWTVEETAGFYSLGTRQPCGLRVYHRDQVQSKQAAALMRLREKWMETPFSAAEASKFLETSPRSSQRLLEEALSEGHLQRMGKSRSTRYFFAASEPEAR